MSAPEAALTKPYPHITLAVAKGAQARDANALPGLVLSEAAHRYVLQEPIQLTGQILGFTVG